MMMPEREFIYEKPTDPRFRDKSGELFNSWLVEGFSHIVFNHETKQRVTYWDCRCTDCNLTIKKIPINNLMSSRSKSCGCAVSSASRDSSILNKQFNYLTVLSLDIEETRIKHTAMYSTKCMICGSITTKPGVDIKSGNVKTCGSVSCRKKSRSDSKLKSAQRDQHRICDELHN